MYGMVGENIRHAPLPKTFFLYRTIFPAYQIPLFGITSIGSSSGYFGICKGIKERVGIM